MPEYGRDYTIKLIEQQGLIEEEPDAEVRSAEWGPEDFAIIAREQQRMEDAAAASGSPLVIADTDALATRLWERRYLGPDSHAARDAVPDIPPRALWLLADYRDVPFVRDSIRDGENYRADVTSLVRGGAHRARRAGAPDQRRPRASGSSMSIRLIDEGGLGLARPLARDRDRGLDLALADRLPARRAPQSASPTTMNVSTPAPIRIHCTGMLVGERPEDPPCRAASPPP